MKQVIFNVGGALCSYISLNSHDILYDVGKSNDFNPILEFLLPLYSKQNHPKTNNKYLLKQLIISHPHNDHISAIGDFNDYLYPELLTCPNCNDGMAPEEKIRWDYFDTGNPNLATLRSMLQGRTPPLRASYQSCQWIYYLPSRFVEENTQLKSESYQNNISIATFIIANNYRTHIPPN